MNYLNKSKNMKKLALHWKIIIVLFLLINMSNCHETTKYKCTICEMSFAEKEWADKCQDWCETQHSCNTEITKHAIKK